MNLTCPCCGGRFSIEAALTDEAARTAVAAALKLPAPLGDLLLRYLGLFRAQGRALSWDRTTRLLRELLEPIQAAQVRRHGRTWPAPLDYWRQALEQMLERREQLQLPLKSHGYLFEIVAGMASKAEGRAEASREEARAAGIGVRSGQGLTAVGEAVKPDKEKNRRGAAALKDILKGRSTVPQD